MCVISLFLATTTLGTTSTSTGKIPGKKDVTGGANRNRNITIIISVLLALLCIIACVFIFFWLKRRSGQSNDYLYPYINTLHKQSLHIK